MSNNSNRDYFNLSPWALLCWAMFFLSLGMFLKTCEKDLDTFVASRKLDSMYQEISKVNSHIDSLKVEKKKIISEEKRIHEETTKTIERILITADSSQHFITEELISKHKQLDSL